MVNQGNPRSPTLGARIARGLHNHVAAVVPPLSAAVALREYPRFLRDRRCYRRMSGERLSWSDNFPQLHDRLETTPFDAHYEYQSVWTAHSIAGSGVEEHVDVGSKVSYVLGLTAFVHVTFVDIRPLDAAVPNLTSLEGDLLALPFDDQSVGSLSCLHVAEHVGLGRYGDQLDPAGTRKAATELERVLGPGGTLYFSLPVGRARTAFNAHRVHDPASVEGMFPALTLSGFAGVDDDGRFLPNADFAMLQDQEYACGFFRFTRS
jgi:SAM-dependent methyltransferase